MKTTIMNFLNKNWSNVLFVIIIILLVIPQTGMPIKVAFNKLIAFSPSVVKEAKRDVLNNYDWNLKTLDGESKNLSDSKQRVSVINLWATWCPPCVAEMPSFQKLYDDYGDKVDFYFISKDQNKAIVKKFMTKKAYTLPVYFSASKIPVELQSNSLPTSYVISKSGSIAINKVGAAAWNSDSMRGLLDDLLKE